MANWLTRDSGPTSCYYIRNKKPKAMLALGKKRWEGADILVFCPELFERMTTKESHLKPGEIRKIKSIHFEFAE